VEETLTKEDEEPLNLVQPINAIKDKSAEVKHHDDGNDEARSSCSREVIEVLNEEENQVT